MSIASIAPATRIEFSYFKKDNTGNWVNKEGFRTGVIKEHKPEYNQVLMEMEDGKYRQFKIPQMAQIRILDVMV